MENCTRCNKQTLEELCGTCRSEWNMKPICENCGSECWDNRKQTPKTARVHNKKFLCKTCFTRRLIPEDKICKGCLQYLDDALKWNKSFGLCKACSLDLKADLLPDDGRCSYCHKEVKYSNEWRFNVLTQSLMCVRCFLGSQPRRPLRQRTQAEYRRERRERLLPADRRCPVCKTIKLKLRSWVITDNSIACRSCHAQGKAVKLIRPRLEAKRYLHESLPDLKLNADGSPVVLPKDIAKCMTCGNVYKKEIGCICGGT